LLRSTKSILKTLNFIERKIEGFYTFKKEIMKERERRRKAKLGRRLLK
jgi:hypothetical protein